MTLATFDLPGGPFVLRRAAASDLPAIVGLRAGALRMQVEAVRVRDDMRSRGLRAEMMRWTLDASHVGFKKSLA